MINWRRCRRDGNRVRVFCATFSPLHFFPWEIEVCRTPFRIYRKILSVHKWKRLQPDGGGKADVWEALHVRCKIRSDLLCAAVRELRQPKIECSFDQYESCEVGIIASISMLASRQGANSPQASSSALRQGKPQEEQLRHRSG